VNEDFLMKTTDRKKDLSEFFLKREKIFEKNTHDGRENIRET
jgi:hypothetical protein